MLSLWVFVSCSKLNFTFTLPVRYHSANATCLFYQEKWTKPGELPKKMLFREFENIG
jgi:hypothetical protein